MAEPILEQIILYLKARVAEITAAAGYQYTLNAKRPKRIAWWTELTSDLTAFVLQGSPDKQTSTYNHQQWSQPVSIFVIAIDSDSSAAAIDTKLNRILADVQKKILDNKQCGGLAINIETDSPDYVFGEKFSAISVNFNVIYRHKHDDPYSLN